MLHPLGMVVHDSQNGEKKLGTCRLCNFVGCASFNHPMENSLWDNTSHVGDFVYSLSHITSKGYIW